MAQWTSFGIIVILTKREMRGSGEECRPYGRRIDEAPQSLMEMMALLMVALNVVVLPCSRRSGSRMLNTHREGDSG